MQGLAQSLSSDVSLLPEPSRTRSTVLHLPLGILHVACQSIPASKGCHLRVPLCLGLRLAEATSVFLGWWIQTGFDEPTSEGVGGQGGVLTACQPEVSLLCPHPKLISSRLVPLELCSPRLGVVRPRASDELGKRGHCWRELRLVSIALQGMRELGVGMGQEPAGAAMQGYSSPVPSLWSPRDLLSPFDSAQGSSVPAVLPGELGSGVLAGLTWSPFCSGSSELVPQDAWVPPWVE